MKDFNKTLKILENIRSRGRWEIGINPDGSHFSKWISPEEILNEVKIMPAKPWYVRLWRKFFPLKGIESPADGTIREIRLK